MRSAYLVRLCGLTFGLGAEAFGLSPGSSIQLRVVAASGHTVQLGPGTDSESSRSFNKTSRSLNMTLASVAVTPKSDNETNAVPEVIVPSDVVGPSQAMRSKDASLPEPQNRWFTECPVIVWFALALAVSGWFWLSRAASAQDEPAKIRTSSSHNVLADAEAWPSGSSSSADIVLLLICIGSGTNRMVEMMLVNFIPREMEHVRGGLPLMTAMIFSVSPLAGLFMAPQVPQLSRMFGRRELMVGGMLLRGLSMLAFGAAGFIPDARGFAAYCVLMNLLAGVGLSLFMCSAYGVIGTLFPARLSYAFSLVEMSVGLGMILGPTVGTILYLFGGFVLPFAIFGVFTLLVAGALFSRLPDFEKAAPLSVRATRCTDATSWSMAFVMLVVITGFSGISIMTSTIEEHLAKPPVNASEFQTGLLISFAMVLFALTSPFVGHFDDEVFTSNGGCVLQTSGLLFVGMALLLEAPCPFIEASLTLPCVWLGQACLGSGAALVLMPTLRRVRGLLTNLDDENRDVVAGSVVAVAILCSYCWGPLVSAYLRTWYSTQWAYCVLGAAAFAVALTHTFHFCCGGRHSEAELS